LERAHGFRWFPLSAILLGLLALSWTAAAANSVLVGWSEVGLHETDGTDFSVYSLMPPYSTIRAQFISGGLLLTNPAGITVTYQAVADASGSINRTSQAKGNLYQNAEALYGKALQPDAGLAGFAMPGLSNQPQPMVFDSARKCFSATGIPLTPYDDQGKKNFFPLMRLVARDNVGNVLATTDLAVPVSDEMDCRACHASGSQVDARPPEGWAWEVDPIRDYKLTFSAVMMITFWARRRSPGPWRLRDIIPPGWWPRWFRTANQSLAWGATATGALPGSGSAARAPSRS